MHKIHISVVWCTQILKRLNTTGVILKIQVLGYYISIKLTDEAYEEVKKKFCFNQIEKISYSNLQVGILKFLNVKYS